MSQTTEFGPFVHAGESFQDRAGYLDTLIGRSLVQEAFAVYSDDLAAGEQFPQTD